MNAAKTRRFGPPCKASWATVWHKTHRDHAENLERAIAAYEQALQVMTRQAMPVEWATTTMNLATAYKNRIRGERAENLERAIAAYEQALQVRTRQAMPVDWAQTTMNLANAYKNRIRGERAENLERAIAAYEQALQVMTRQAMPVEWATTTSNLATAYYSRIRGDAENLERHRRLRASLAGEDTPSHARRLGTNHQQPGNRLLFSHPRRAPGTPSPPTSKPCK
ncbi:MAG: tetratricopeptide repeat protein [Caldilineaceae bacterium]